jgi:hypothetical protein
MTRRGDSDGRSFPWKYTMRPGRCSGGDRDNPCRAKPIVAKTDGVTLCATHFTTRFEELLAGWDRIWANQNKYRSHIQKFYNILTELDDDPVDAAREFMRVRAEVSMSQEPEDLDEEIQNQAPVKTRAPRREPVEPMRKYVNRTARGRAQDNSIWTVRNRPMPETNPGMDELIRKMFPAAQAGYDKIHGVGGSGGDPETGSEPDSK